MLIPQLHTNVLPGHQLCTQSFYATPYSLWAKHIFYTFLFVFSVFFLHNMFHLQWLSFTYNDYLSHHRPSKQRTWTQSCHSHVIAAKSCPQRCQHAKNDKWPENKGGWLSAAVSIFLRIHLEIKNSWIDRNYVPKSFIKQVNGWIQNFHQQPDAHMNNETGFASCNHSSILANKRCFS